MRNTRTQRTRAWATALGLLGILAIVGVEYAEAARGGQGAATEHIWVSPLGFVPEDLTTTLTQSPVNPKAIQVTTSDTTVNHTIQIGLTLPDGAAIGVGSVKAFQIQQVRLCYEVVVGAVGASIVSGDIAEMTTPDASTANSLASAAFPLTSTTPTCADVALTSPFAVGGAETLQLVLHFGDTGSAIRLGGLRLDLKVLP